MGTASENKFPSSLIEATQTLSREINLDKLIEKMMQIVLEHVGAQRGFLLQYDNNRLLIQAKGSLRSGIRVLQSKSPGKSNRLAIEVVDHVIKSKKVVVIDNAVEDVRFNASEYIQSKNVKSVLCLPIFVKGNMASVIYLENNQKKKAFTEDVLHSLQFLTTQMTISLENALLYKNLEKKVDERTRELSKQKSDLEKAHKELKFTQAQLVHSEKMASMGQLTAGVAHEINNPVNFITVGINGLEKNFRVYKDLLKMYEKLQPKDDLETKLKSIRKFKKDNRFKEVKQYVSDLMDDIRLGAERTAEIVRGLRNFSRTDQSTSKGANVHDCINDTLTIIRNKLLDIELILKYDTTMSSIQCYPGQLNQVFLNILTNAIDAIHSPANKNKTNEIVITTKNRERDITISIKDTGVGIKKIDKSKIFDPFFTTKEVGKGMGLGLSISYGIIEKHDGLMDVISKPGQGTEFIITLPKQ